MEGETTRIRPRNNHTSILDRFGTPGELDSAVD
jgi:hypothetical protein